MSNALNYLLKARPEAMGLYFKFLKETGTELDPKTRNLISVITKVAVQTERGLKQYLSRALREGCTPAEIIDALLMAFPALGLAKIVWAVDIILEMDIPEFDPDTWNVAPEWHEIAPLADIPEGKPVRLEHGDKAMFIYRNGSGIQVFDSHCPHQVTNIPELALDGTVLTCPKHEWVFDITTGACIDKGHEPLRKLENKIEGNNLYVLW